MQLKNLECQLAMAQLKRYLSGAKLSEEALEALEAHLVDCATCQLAVQLQQQKSPAPSPEFTHAVVETPAPTPAQESVANVEKPRLKMPKIDFKGNAKTLTLSATLAAVLIAMSALANDPTKLFGDRAMKPGQKLPAGKVVPATPAPVAKAPAKEAPAAQPAPAAPKVEPVAVTPPKPKPRPRAVSRPAPRRPARPAQRPTSRPVAKPAQAVPAGIAVYDENGNQVR